MVSLVQEFDAQNNRKERVFLFGPVNVMQHNLSHPVIYVGQLSCEASRIYYGICVTSSIFNFQNIFLML